MFLKYTILCTLLMAPLSAMAERLTLVVAYQQALHYDATLNAARADNVAQKEEKEKAFSSFLPKVSSSLSRGPSWTESDINGRVTPRAGYDSQNYNVSLRQAIYNKAYLIDYDKAGYQIEKSNAQLGKESISLMSRVTGAYLDILLATENIRYSEAQKASVVGQLEQANKRLKSGLGTITEISEAQANLDDVTAKAIEWINSLEYANRSLENLTGTYPTQLSMLDTARLPLSPPKPDSVELWIASAVAKNPDILAAQQDIEIGKREVEKSGTGHLPTLDMVASRANTMSDQNYTIGQKYKTDSLLFQLSIPMYAGGYVNASVRQSVAKLEQAREVLNDKIRIASIDVRKYYNALVNGISKIQAYEQLVTSRDVALIGTQKGFEAGIRTNVEVLNAQEKLYSAKRDLIKERYQLIFNRIQLKQSAGVLDQSDIHEVDSWLSL